MHHGWVIRPIANSPKCFQSENAHADVYSSPANNSVPSAGSFRSDIKQLMTEIVNFLNSNNAPFVINIYPYLSLYYSAGFPVDYAFFNGCSKPVIDKSVRYTNVFDANYDTLVYSLKKAGVPDMKIIVGEVGWPTDGDKRANASMAQKFYNGFLKKMMDKAGTPLRPGPMQVYLFGLFDEDMKSVLPGNFERHWGIFRYDGKPKFKLDYSGKGQDIYPVAAEGVHYLPKQWCVYDDTKKDKKQYIPDSVNYACSDADCTSLGFGSSCYGSLDQKGNISYAFNMYFQTMSQDVRACDFHGLGKITNADPSTGNCLFPVQIVSAVGRMVEGAAAAVMATVAVAVMTVA